MSTSEELKTEGLKNGITTFWKTLSPKVCCKHTNYIKKIIPIVIKRKVMHQDTKCTNDIDN